MTATRSQRLRDRLHPFLLGAASLFDLSGALTCREAREALPPADDWKAVGGYFGEAGRLLREAMGDAGISDEEGKP
jgi:hypothetical protein